MRKVYPSRQPPLLSRADVSEALLFSIEALRNIAIEVVGSNRLRLSEEIDRLRDIQKRLQEGIRETY